MRHKFLGDMRISEAFFMWSIRRFCANISLWHLSLLYHQTFMVTLKYIWNFLSSKMINFSVEESKIPFYENLCEVLWLCISEFCDNMCLYLLCIFMAIPLVIIFESWDTLYVRTYETLLLDICKGHKFVI